MRKLFPSVSYWVTFVIFLFITIFTLEIYKNKQIDFFKKKSFNNFNLQYNNHLKNYNDLAELIFLNDLKVHKNLVSIENEILLAKNSNILEKKVKFNFEKKLIVFYFFENEDSQTIITKVNFDLDNFFNELDSLIMFSLKFVNKNDFLEEFNLQDSENFYLFKNESHKYFGFLKNIENQDILVYKNISNTHISKIDFNFLLIYICILALYLLIMFLTFYYLSSYTEQKKYKHDYNEIMQAIDKHVLMLKLDLNNNIVFATKSFCEWSAHTQKDLIGKKYETLIPSDVSPKFLDKIKEELNEHKLWEGEFKNKDIYGNVLWSKGVVIPNYNEKGEISFYSMILTDISDNKQMTKINDFLKEELSNKLNEIQIKEENYKDKMKVQLMSKILDSLTHQWQKPISNIHIDLTKFSAYFLENGLEDEKLLNIHKNITNELKNLSISLNNFKSMFIKDNEHNKYNLHSVLKDAMTTCQNDINHHNVKIKLDANKDIECYGTPIEIKHIVVSLFKYSFEQFDEQNIEDPKIDLIVISDHGNILLKYSDNSVNSNSNLISEILESKDNELLLKDLNVNLYIIKLLVEKTDSKIWFENRDNKTEFYLKLKQS